MISSRKDYVTESHLMTLRTFPSAHVNSCKYIWKQPFSVVNPDVNDSLLPSLFMALIKANFLIILAYFQANSVHTRQTEMSSQPS